MASWFIIDVLGCPQRRSHEFLSQVLCSELDLHVASLGRVLKRGDRALSSVFQIPNPLETPRSHSTHKRPLPSSTSNPSPPHLLLSLDCAQPNPRWCHLLPHVAPRGPFFLLQLGHLPSHDLWHQSRPLESSGLSTANSSG